MCNLRQSIKELFNLGVSAYPTRRQISSRHSPMQITTPVKHFHVFMLAIIRNYLF